MDELDENAGSVVEVGSLADADIAQANTEVEQALDALDTSPDAPQGLTLAYEKDKFLDNVSLDVTSSDLDVEIYDDPGAEQGKDVKGMKGWSLGLKLGLGIGGGLLLVIIIIAIIFFMRRK
jgi:hypothetical protein